MDHKSKKCMSVGNSRILSSVSSLQPTLAYVEGWNIHQKLGILSIFDFWSRLSGQFGNIALCLGKNHKHLRHLRLVAHIFTKFSQTVCLINIHISIYRHTRCDRMLWNALWFYNIFLAFSYITIDCSCLYCCPPNFHWLYV